VPHQDVGDDEMQKDDDEQQKSDDEKQKGDDEKQKDDDEKQKGDEERQMQCGCQWCLGKDHELRARTTVGSHVITCARA
jgi:hypothetical protein